MIPIGDSLLYVRSLFVSGDEESVPKLRRVIASFQSSSGSNIAVDETLAGALGKLGFGEIPEGVDDTNVGGGTTTPPDGTEDPGATQAQKDEIKLALNTYLKPVLVA